LGTIHPRSKLRGILVSGLNSIGEIVLEINESSLSSVDRLDISKLPNGIYYIEARNNERICSTKFVVSR